MSIFRYPAPQSEREKGYRDAIAQIMHALKLKEVTLSRATLSDGIAGKRLGMYVHPDGSATFTLREDVEIEGQALTPASRRLRDVTPR